MTLEKVYDELIAMIEDVKRNMGSGGSTVEVLNASEVGEQIATLEIDGEYTYLKNGVREPVYELLCSNTSGFDLTGDAIFTNPETGATLDQYDELFFYFGTPTDQTTKFCVKSLDLKAIAELNDTTGFSTYGTTAAVMLEGLIEGLAYNVNVANGTISNDPTNNYTTTGTINIRLFAVMGKRHYIPAIDD